MKAGLFIATAALYAIACILYLFQLTRGSDKAPRLPGTIFVAALGAYYLFGDTFSIKEAAAIGIIGGADGPTSIFLTAKLAPHLIGPIAIAAYSYMALIPVIQPPIMRLLTTREERLIRRGSLRGATSEKY